MCVCVSVCVCAHVCSCLAICVMVCVLAFSGAEDACVYVRMYICLSVLQAEEVWSRYGSSDQVMSSLPRLTVRRCDLMTLKGLEWLNDEVRGVCACVCA